MSFFFALKGMSNAPVESMKEGGLFWFTDLTICDPYYILPVLTSITVWATIEVTTSCKTSSVYIYYSKRYFFQLGTDSARLTAQGSPLLIYFFRAIPLIMFPITMNFSGVGFIMTMRFTFFITYFFLGYFMLLADNKYNFSDPSRFSPHSESS